MPASRRVLISGASGLVGSELTRALRAAGDEALQLVRRPARNSEEREWDPAAGRLDAAALDGVDAVVNLSGASIGRIPWTPAYRRELRDSRLAATRTIAEALAAAGRGPLTLINASAVGFYGDRPGERLTEDSTPGSGFLPELVKDWEAAAHGAPDRTRVVTIRSGVVVAHGGGFGPVRQLTQFGLGTRFGSGGQFWPWISLHDEVAAIIHLLGSDIEGPVNLVGPTPATSDRVTRVYAQQLHRPRALPAPEFAVRMLGEAGQRLLLDSMEVVPTRLRADGFRWRDSEIDDAVAAVVRGDA
ncbi:TIGR01777 family oxidoreductase [Schumannella sp. 10F1B-5-1]|uniref:TIGR01777 family oxidoreductase n=1 Tax=Schumannella sp. 10F1B-5-1 TaxID=2590780 RepID=UPI001130E742|nr:TIGR01777 family oxidoreductase [Schumannella sp. 10F1B-5-1]TPW70247.1 TIGR01777 family protein [Schumannella sp. 10F1B-5-1]